MSSTVWTMRLEAEREMAISGCQIAICAVTCNMSIEKQFGIGERYLFALCLRVVPVYCFLHCVPQTMLCSQCFFKRETSSPSCVTQPRDRIVLFMTQLIARHKSKPMQLSVINMRNIIKVYDEVRKVLLRGASRGFGYVFFISNKFTGVRRTWLRPVPRRHFLTLHR